MQKCFESLMRIYNQASQDLLITATDSAKLLQDCCKKLSYDLTNKDIAPSIFQVHHSDENVKDVKSVSHLPIPLDIANRILSYSQNKEQVFR